MELLQGLKVILSVRKAPQCCDPLLTLLTFHKQNLSYINTQFMFRMMFLMASLSMTPELKGTTPQGSATVNLVTSAQYFSMAHH